MDAGEWFRLGPGSGEPYECGRIQHRKCGMQSHATNFFRASTFLRSSPGLSIGVSAMNAA